MEKEFTMLKSVLHNYAFNLEYAKMLMADIADDQMCTQPADIKNHPAWTIGHLAYASSYAAILVGLEPAVPENWAELFGRNVSPVDDRSTYPSKEELMQAIEQQHGRVSEALTTADPAIFDGETPDEEFRQIMPTVGDALGYLLVSHEATHLGQLSAWRRAMGMGSVFG